MERLHTHSSVVPEGTWQGIQHRRKKKDKKGLLWFSLLGTAIVVLAGITWMVFQEKPTNTAENKAPLVVTPQEQNEVVLTASENQVSTVEKAEKIEAQNEVLNNKTEAMLVTNIGVGMPATSDKTNQKSFGGEVDNSIEPDNHRPEQSEVKVSANQGQMVTLASLPGLMVPVYSTQTTPQSLVAPDPCFSFTESTFKLSGFYVELLGGMDLPFKSLQENNPNEDLGYYREARDTSEQDWYAFSAQLGLGMQYENGLSIRTGLHYLQINEIFEYADASIIRTIQVELKDSDGNVIGTQTVVEEGYRYIKTHNRLRFLDVPLQLGWEKRKGDISFGFYGGATLNLMFKQKGAFFSKDLEPVSFSSSAEEPYDYFKAKAGLTATANLSFGYYLNDNLSWRIEPQFRYQLAPLNKSLLEQRYSTVGLWTGLRYDF